MLRRKYLKDRTITQVEHMPGDSQFCTGLMKVKQEFFSLGRFNLGDGLQVRFWEDTWIGTRPFKELYQGVYNIVRKKSAIVKTMLYARPLNVSFRRSLVGANLIAWNSIVARVMNV